MTKPNLHLRHQTVGVRHQSHIHKPAAHQLLSFKTLMLSNLQSSPISKKCKFNHRTLSLNVSAYKVCQIGNRVF